MLELKKVSKYYYNKGVVSTGFRKIDLKLNIGEFVAIVGESGSGKSTLVNVLSGLDSYEEGEMYVNGQKTSHYTSKDFEMYRKNYVSNIYQEFNLVNSYTVYQNIELVAMLNGYKKKDVRQEIIQIIEKVGLTKYKNTKVSKLSGGQKQRVAIARALIKNSPIIIADEPTGNIDSESAKQVISLLKELSKDKLVIVVTHNIEQVENVATRKIKMHDGRIIEDTTFEEKPQVYMKPANNKELKLVNKIKLSFRNTFNILPKFLLLFAIFLFITLAVTGQYTLFLKTMEESQDNAFNYTFKEQSDERIIIKDKDNGYISKETLEKVRKLKDVDYVVDNDRSLEIDVVSRGTPFIYAAPIRIEQVKKISLGKMPQNKDEVILIVNEMRKSEINEKLLGKEIEVVCMGKEESKIKLKVVGIEYKDDVYDKIAFTKEKLEEIMKNEKEIITTYKLDFKDNIRNIFVQKTDKLEQGKVLVPDTFNMLDEKGDVKKQKLTITSDYYTEINKLELEIKDVYNKETLKKDFKIDAKLDPNTVTIFVSQEDYNKFITSNILQSSVYVKDEKSIENVKNELKQLGLQPLAVKDTKQVGSPEYELMSKVILVVFTILVLFGVFFISYFLIKIVFKSRNVYYTTVRMLGASKNVVRQLLEIELLLVQTIAYIVTFAGVIAINKGYINNMFLAKLTSYIDIKSAIVLFITLTVLTILIARKYAKELYKKTAINTYFEEV